MSLPKDSFYKNFQGFKHCSIFHFQGSVCCLFSSATRSLYQSCLILSSTFLKFFRSVFASLLLNSNFGSLSYLVVFVNNFFTLFFQALYQQFALEWKKESFGIERRKRDLNPRAGCPTYTLSRGASSASWVFLRTCDSIWSRFETYFVVKRMSNYTWSIRVCQQVFWSFLFFFQSSPENLPFFLIKAK